MFGSERNLNSSFCPCRNRKTKAKSPTGQTPLVEIPEEEKWRLIQESGLLERFNDADKSPSTSSSTPTPPLTTDSEEHDGPSPLFEEIFNALMIIMPHTFFLIMMDM
ncbi:hypothetical protein JVT61DRAFT_13095 [Boletus reticuloceps]|uniref:Uncharacterized protein n=1 Tax=Boletus reticuloceps TaxID=495285 RepID=A0A8I3ADX0_9AGAM|nr:hypothetical protein JVT61DRAFT_13095 [Boletus reticuloceps]